MKVAYTHQFDIDEMIKPEDVDLTSFAIKDTLNPGLWKTEDKMQPKVRKALLVIAKDFVENLAIDWIKPEDVVVTGSAANYNWDINYSDIDLHIIIDTKKVSNKKDFVEKYFKDAKNEWNNRHELHIASFPVELYVQDKKEPHKAGGVYSILTDRWLTKPDKAKLNNGKFNKKEVQNIASDLMNKIDDVEERLKKYKADNDIQSIKKLYTEACGLFDDIKNERKKGTTKKNFEMSAENLAFKVLRRTKYIEKISNIKTTCYDIIHSY